MAPSRRKDVVLFLLGAALFDGSRRLVRPGEVSPAEERVFRAANDASDAIRVPVRTVMQMGTFGTVPAVGALAFLTGRRRLGAAIALGGTAAWLLAKQAKPLGARPRPAEILPEVRLREGIEGDLGWVSGHTAVATTIACVSWDAVPAWAHPFLVAGVAATGYGRMYVGAHLPLDLVGGAGLGLAISSLARGLAGD
jgi:membrane-associated phospholipid phosphatase